MDDLQTRLAEAQERHAHYRQLLAERSAVAEAAKAALAEESTYPRKRREVEAELSAAETDLGWIHRDAVTLGDRVRLLEADLAQMMAAEIEAAQAQARKERTATAVATEPERASG
jgi:hypothetical protein